MKTVVTIGLFFLAALTMSGCGSRHAIKKEQTPPAFFLEPNEAIAVMPFETESVLSNLGALLSGEVIVNLLEHRPELKIIHAPVMRTYMLNAGGLPDVQKLQSLKTGLQCRYLLTGNLFTQLGNVTYTPGYVNRIATGSVTVLLVDCDSSTVVWAKHVKGDYSTLIYNNGNTIYQTDGELLQSLIKILGAEVAKNFYAH